MTQTQMIEKYLKLAIKIGHRLCPRKDLRDDYVSEAFLTLVRLANKIVNEPTLIKEGEDVKKYILAAIWNDLKRFRHQYRVVRLKIYHSKTLIRQGKYIAKETTLTALPSKATLQYSIPFFIADISQTPVEQQVLTYRAAGWDDVDIGQELKLTKARIGQIRKQVAERNGYST